MADSTKIENITILDQIRSCAFEPEQIGAGAYGTIFSVRDYEGIIYALKYIKLDPAKYILSGFEGLQEIDILRRIDHPHIIHSVNIITSLSCNLQDSLAIIMPLADMTLTKAIVSNLFNTETKINIMYKLATAVDFLHFNNILHLDIKNANIVLRGTEPYLIDFGLAMFVDNADKGRYYPYELVTVTNRPPEIFAGSRQYNTAVDIWSIGMVILSLLSGKDMLFSQWVTWGDNTGMLKELEVLTEQIPELLRGISTKYRIQCLSLLQGMLAFDPKQRLTSNQVLEHVLFDDFRTMIVGSINEQRYNPIYTSDHRDILKVMLLWAREVFINNSAQSLFLAIDIYNRAGVFYLQSTTNERMSLAAMCLVVSMKLLDQPYLALDLYLAKINQLVPEITLKELLRAETEIISYLDGILYGSPFFDKLTTGDELILTFSHIIMDRDSTLYLRVDYDAWARQVKQLATDNKYPTKNITISQLLAL